MMKTFRLFCWGLLLLSGLSCSTEFDPTAEPRDIWVVYGVLTPDDTVQYVRISKAFLPESDAFVYARENDQSVPGLQVTLTEEGSNRVFEATQVDSVLKTPEDGLFYPFTTLYKFSTIGADRLDANTRYTLTVRQPGDETFALTAETRIPEKMRITGPSFQPGPGASQCLQQVPLESDITVFFSNSEGAVSYEARAILDYTAGGSARQAVFGPTPLFVDDRGCRSSGSICYRFEAKTVLRSFLDQIDPQPNVAYRYGVTDENRCRNNSENLPSVFRFEITAMDQHLTRYRQAGASRLTESNTLATQYTNVEGSEDMLTLGILGSHAIQNAKARLTPCSEFLLGLNDTPRPPGTACEL